MAPVPREYRLLLCQVAQAAVGEGEGGGLKLDSEPDGLVPLSAYVQQAHALTQFFINLSMREMHIVYLPVSLYHHQDHHQHHHQVLVP